MDTDFNFVTLGLLASRLQNTVVQAVEQVKVSSIQLAEDVKEKSKPLTDSIAENAEAVKLKSMELAETVKEKSSTVAESVRNSAVVSEVKKGAEGVMNSMVVSEVKKGAVVVAESVQGRVAPKSVKREGFLSKQVNGSKWEEFFFILKDGTLQAQTTQTSLDPEFSVSVDCIQRAEALDMVVTANKPYCFRLVVKLLDKPDTIVNNWAFFNSGFFSSNKVNNQEVDIILQGTTEDEMRGWVRELSSTSSGLVLQDQVKKTGEGALKFASTARAISFMGSLTSLVGIRTTEVTEEAKNDQ